MQAAFQAFKNKIGEQLNNPLDYNGQCTGASNDWAESIGKRGFTGNANTWPGQNHDQWNWIANTPNNVPTQGSIVCFAPNNPAVGTGPAGHVDVFDSGNANAFQALDQNWGGVQVLKEVPHSYAGVMGWLQPIEAATPPPAPAGGTAKVIHAVNVRMAPSTSSAITSVLQVGNTFQYQNKVVGQSVAGNNIWYHSTLGHFVWSGDCTG